MSGGSITGLPESMMGKGLWMVTQCQECPWLENWRDDDQAARDASGERARAHVADAHPELSE